MKQFEQELSESLILLQNGGERSPLFLVPPVQGSPYCYRGMLSYLGADLPVYGFETPGLRKGPVLRTIAEMAQVFLIVLREVQPRGPYRLAGWSLGGVIAFEMARALLKEGEQVEYLGLIDASLSFHERAERSFLEILSLTASWSRSFLDIRFPFSLEELKHILKWNDLIFPFRFEEALEEEGPGLLHYFRRLLTFYPGFIPVYSAGMRAGLEYVPGPYSGDADIYRSESKTSLSPSDAAKIIQGQIRFQEVPGHHISMLDPENIPAFAKPVGKRLRELDETPA